MRYDRWVAYFRRAVFLTLALPACGSDNPTGNGAPGDSGPLADSGALQDAIPLPQTPCDWVAGPTSPCSWSFGFTGLDTTCAGFSGEGTSAQCIAICGANNSPCGSSAGGQGANSCSIVTYAYGGTLYCVVDEPSNVAPWNGGRRPAYFASLGFAEAPRGRELGVHFARVACMEAGSVEAFRALRDELVAHGAPLRIVRAVRRAVRDERRHVRQTSALARRFGEAPITPRPGPPRAVRTIAAMALENAVEGCVRETYSAMECAWQAEAARDTVVRATMKRIARDEMRHLAVAWAVHAWATARIDADARVRIRDAQHREVATLLREVSRDPHPDLVEAGGLPRAHQSRALIGAIAEAVGGQGGRESRSINSLHLPNRGPSRARFG